MTNAIASKLETLANSELDLIAWENVELQWQAKIEQAITTEILPSYLVYPHNTESLADIVNFAHQNRTPVLICGSGSKLNWGGLVKDPQLVISTQRLNQIIEHAVGDLTVTVEAGVNLADLQNMLKQVNQFLPINPAYPESATIGGIVATADAGSWRQRYGGVRDMLLGLSFIRADGKIAKAGGRVVKNVAGYDLMKLFTGSYGTLGIISQVTFRVYPLSEASQTIILTGEENAIAKATQALLNSALTPTAAAVVSSSVINRLEIGKGMGLIVRFQSILESIKEQSIQIESVGQQLGLETTVYRDQEEEHLWQQLQETILIPDTSLPITCKIGVMPNTIVKFLSQLDELTYNQGLGMVNISSGLGKLYLSSEEALDQLKKLRSLSQEYRGFLTILDAPLSIKQKLEPWGYTGNALEIMCQLKHKFDPENILNPGKFG